MPRRRLYTLSIPTDAQLETGRQVRRRTASIAPLGEGTAVGQSIAPEPGSLRLAGSYRGALADVMAREYEELHDADGYEVVPLFATEGESTDRDGYYVLQEADTAPAAPQAEAALHTFDSRLELSGTRQSHFRSVSLASQSVDTDFGTATEAFVGVPAAATDALTRWYDPTANTLTNATPTTTVTTEFGDVNLYDVAAAPSATDAALVYDLPYADQGPTDVRVWDDRGRGLAGREDADGVVQWARVFTTSHEYQGRPIISNGRIRVLFDGDPAAVPGLSVEAYTAGSWSSVALGNNPDNFRVTDVDFSRVGPAATTAQVLFEDGSGTRHPLNVRLTRGADDIVLANPANEPDPTPSGLQTLLDPVAAGRVKTANERLDIRPRSEVRR